MEKLLYFMYKEAAKRAKEKNVPEMAYEKTRQQSIGEAQPYWEQYRYEVEDWQKLVESMGPIPSIDVKLSKKHKCIIYNCIDQILPQESNFTEEEKQVIFYDILAVCIIDSLTPRRLEKETLIQQTWTRHALILEVVNQIEKIYIYNKKTMSSEAKKTHVLVTLAVIEALSKHGLIKQDKITIHSGDFISLDECHEINEILNSTVPHIQEKKHEEIRTIYTYSTLREFTLELNPNY